MKIIIRYLIYIMFVLLVGLVPILLSEGENFIFKGYSELNDFIPNGTLLFFSITIVATLILDYFFLRDERFHDWFVGIFIVMVPGSIIIICISLFLIEKYNPKEVGYFMIEVKLFILIATCLYAIFINVVLDYLANKKSKILGKGTSCTTKLTPKEREN